MISHKNTYLRHKTDHAWWRRPDTSAQGSLNRTLEPDFRYQVTGCVYNRSYKSGSILESTFLMNAQGGNATREDMERTTGKGGSERGS